MVDHDVLKNMSMRSFVLFFALLLSTIAAALAQDDLTTMASIPATYKLEELPKRMVPWEMGQLGARNNGGLLEDIMGMFTSLFSGSLSVNDDAEGAFLGLVNLHFTEGKLVDLLDGKFLVTYKIGLDIAGKSSEAMSTMPEIKSAYWRVVFVRVSEIKTIGPATNWSLEKAIATIQKLIEKSKAEAAKRAADKKDEEKPAAPPKR